MIRNINEKLGDTIVFDSLDEMTEAVRECGYLPKEGLVEGRDYEEVSQEQESPEKIKSKFLDYFEKADPAQEGNRNSECYRLACIGHDMGLDVPAILDGMRLWNAGKDQPPLNEAELLKTVTSAKATAKTK